MVCMMKPFFTQADCDIDYDPGCFIQPDRSKWAITPEKANRLLQERGKVVYGKSENPYDWQNYPIAQTCGTHNYRALLINIEPIEEPDSAEKIVAEIANFRPGFSWVNIIERAKKLVGK